MPNQENIYQGAATLFIIQWYAEQNDDHYYQTTNQIHSNVLINYDHDHESWFCFMPNHSQTLPLGARVLVLIDNTGFKKWFYVTKSIPGLTTLRETKSPKGFMSLIQNQYEYIQIPNCDN